MLIIYNILNFITNYYFNSESSEQRDISAIMRQRAELGYSMDVCINRKYKLFYINYF